MKGAGGHWVSIPFFYHLSPSVQILTSIYQSPFFSMRPTSVRLWQYSYRTALEIAAPYWPKTSERTQVNTGWSTRTAHQPLPSGLCRPMARLPPLNLSLFNQTLLGNFVGDVPNPEFQPQIECEADVMYVLPTSHPYLHPRTAIMPVPILPYSRE